MHQCQKVVFPLYNEIRGYAVVKETCTYCKKQKKKKKSFNKR